MTSPPLKGLASRREFRGLTQEDMAVVAGCSQSQYHKFEKGLVRLDVHRAAKLARRLGCSIDELL
jgi:transcriptional regulator with XRE-family HTH domain